MEFCFRELARVFPATVADQDYVQEVAAANTCLDRAHGLNVWLIHVNPPNWVSQLKLKSQF